MLSYNKAYCYIDRIWGDIMLKVIKKYINGEN